jgi:hypothetical protein
MRPDTVQTLLPMLVVGWLRPAIRRAMRPGAMHALLLIGR